MARRAVDFKATNLKRAVRAIRETGLPIARVEIDKAGKIVVVSGEPVASANREANEWDT
jgi:hypothetical protein